MTLVKIGEETFEASFHPDPVVGDILEVTQNVVEDKEGGGKQLRQIHRLLKVTGRVFENSPFGTQAGSPVVKFSLRTVYAVDATEEILGAPL
jgi:hypothetical protein